MANVNLKTDFKDGEKLFGQQLNNNFSVIKAALEAMNKIVWQDDPNDSVTAFRGTTEEINQRDIIDGQLLYDTTTGETYIDVGSQRISTGSGNSIHIGSDAPTNPSTQIWIDPNEPLQAIGTEVTNSMEGTESNKAPSVQAVKNYIDNIYSTDEVKTNKIWIDGSPIYRKTLEINFPTSSASSSTPHNISNISMVIFAYIVWYDTTDNKWYINFKDTTGDYYIEFDGVTSNEILIKSATAYNWNGRTKDRYAILYYTKTNDSVGGE